MLKNNFPFEGKSVASIIIKSPPHLSNKHRFSALINTLRCVKTNLDFFSYQIIFKITRLKAP